MFYFGKGMTMRSDYPDENTYQFESEKEFAAFLGINLETIDGDYAEAYQHMSKYWDNVKVDKIFDLHKE